MQYRRIVALVDRSSADLAEAVVAQAGWAYELLDESTLEKPPVGRIGVVVYAPLEAAGDAAPTVETLEHNLSSVGVDAAIASALCDEEEWRDVWKAFFKPRPIGPFVIVPSWERYEESPDQIVLSLDPGRAFGTGGHASTRLCLRAIAQLEKCGRVLDVGCGSGILAIACVRKFPDTTGRAIDIDPEAVGMTEENTLKNGVAGRLRADTTPLEKIDEQFDVILGNLSAETLAVLAPALTARLARMGHFIASGLLITQADAVERVFEQQGLVCRSKLDEEEWRALVFQLEQARDR